MPMKKTDRKQQILQEATRLFSKEGYDKVTIKQLAKAVGISEPALYRHYPSKEAIYDATLESLKTRLNTELLFAKLSQENDIELILTRLAEHIISFYSKNTDLYRLLLFSALRGDTKANQVFQLVRGSYIKFLIKQLDRLYKKGEIIKKKNDITARCFIGMVFDCSLGTTLWRGFQGKVYKPADIVANNIPIYVRGLKS